MGKRAAAGLEISGGVFGIEPDLDRRAARDGLDHIERRQVPGRAFHHPLHQVHAGDFLGDPVFDLEPGIHFEEIEFSGCRIEHELHGARRAVTDRLREADRGRQQLLTHTVG